MLLPKVWFLLRCLSLEILLNLKSAHHSDYQSHCPHIKLNQIWESGIPHPILFGSAIHLYVIYFKLSLFIPPLVLLKQMASCKCDYLLLAYYIPFWWPDVSFGLQFSKVCMLLFLIPCILTRLRGQNHRISKRIVPTIMLWRKNKRALYISHKLKNTPYKE